MLELTSAEPTQFELYWPTWFGDRLIALRRIMRILAFRASHISKHLTEQGSFQLLRILGLAIRFVELIPPDSWC